MTTPVRLRPAKGADTPPFARALRSAAHPSLDGIDASFLPAGPPPGFASATRKPGPRAGKTERTSLERAIHAHEAVGNEAKASELRQVLGEQRAVQDVALRATDRGVLQVQDRSEDNKENVDPDLVSALSQRPRSAAKEGSVAERETPGSPSPSRTGHLTLSSLSEMFSGVSSPVLVPSTRRSKRSDTSADSNPRPRSPSMASQPLAR